MVVSEDSDVSATRKTTRLDDPKVHGAVQVCLRELLSQLFEQLCAYFFDQVPHSAHLLVLPLKPFVLLELRVL